VSPLFPGEVKQQAVWKNLDLLAYRVLVYGEGCLVGDLRGS
jgi:hypothetical protein